jgi:hypothetical protein
LNRPFTTLITWAVISKSLACRDIFGLPNSHLQSEANINDSFNMRTGLSLTFSLSERLVRAALKSYCHNSAVVNKMLKEEEKNSRVG